RGGRRAPDRASPWRSSTAQWSDPAWPALLPIQPGTRRRGSGPRARLRHAGSIASCVTPWLGLSGCGRPARRHDLTVKAGSTARAGAASGNTTQPSIYTASRLQVADLLGGGRRHTACSPLLPWGYTSACWISSALDGRYGWYW